ncbi:hypothetical protein C0416_00880 [bacterium]|nr:hypothetical protein [bacterium]
MNAEVNRQRQPEEEDRLYLDSLILQLQDKDPEKAKSARTELEDMRVLLKVAFIQAKNALKVLEVTKTENRNQEAINEKRKEGDSLFKRMDLIRSALKLNDLKKSLPIPNAKPFGSKN